jgi:hypothetical protein
MTSKSYCRSSAWARVVAGLGLLMALGPAAADPATDAPAKAPVTSSPALPASAFKVICLQNTRCFSAKAPPATAAASAATLDLRAPALTRVFTPAELAEKLQEPEDPYEYTETVQVEGERQLAPVSVGLMAIPWAILHPTQAWRILMPVPSAK